MAEAAKEYKVSQPTLYARRNALGQIKSANVKRLKVREQENAQLKKLMAALGIQVLNLRGRDGGDLRDTRPRAATGICT